MEQLLFVTAWLALGLFALAELGRAHRRTTWPRCASAAGFVLLVAHVLLAMEVRHGWRHASATLATAQQTRELYGLDWGGGLYLNYLFLALWGGLLWRWDTPPAWRAARLLWRAFALILVVNAAIVFASGWRRALGALIAGALILAWSRRARADRGGSAQRAQS